MERLEQAARLSMGGVTDTELPAATSPHIPCFRAIAFAIVAAGALAIVLSLF
jgi:hypothetical protein